jgi:hypothetical protein
MFVRSYWLTFLAALQPHLQLDSWRHEELLQLSTAKGTHEATRLQDACFHKALFREMEVVEVVEMELRVVRAGCSVPSRALSNRSCFGPGLVLDDHGTRGF